MTASERTETIQAMQAVAEDLVRVSNSLNALTRRNDARGFYDHLAGGVEVPDGEGTRTLDPATDRDVVIPGTHLTLGEVLDWNFAMNSLAAFIADEPGQQHESPGLLKRMFGFVSPSSTV